VEDLKKLIYSFLIFLITLQAISTGSIVNANEISVPSAENYELNQALVEELHNEYGNVEQEIDLEMNESKENVLVEINQVEEDFYVDVSIDINTETGDILVSSITLEDSELDTHEFSLNLISADEEEFVGSLVDLETGETYYIDSTQLEASAVPLVVVAIHVVRFGVQAAIKKYGKKIVNNAIKKNAVKMKLTTNSAAREAAKALGYNTTNHTSHGAPVFTRGKGAKGPKYITPDRTSHKGGVWKGATSVKNLGSKSTRSGTYDASLKRIGD
jgi:hypothetical protein